MSQDSHSSKLCDMNSHPSPFPAFRSQSAVCYDQLSSPMHSTIESTQRTMAMRRPPAGFNLQRKDEPRNTFPSLATVRSVPASRCNSEDFAELWTALDSVHIDEDNRNNYSSTGYRENSHFRTPRNPSSRINSKERDYSLAPQFDASFLDDDQHNEGNIILKPLILQPHTIAGSQIPTSSTLMSKRKITQEIL